MNHKYIALALSCSLVSTQYASDNNTKELVVRYGGPAVVGGLFALATSFWRSGGIDTKALNKILTGIDTRLKTLEKAKGSSEDKQMSKLLDALDLHTLGVDLDFTGDSAKRVTVGSVISEIQLDVLKLKRETNVEALKINYPDLKGDNIAAILLAIYKEMNANTTIGDKRIKSLEERMSSLDTTVQKHADKIVALNNKVDEIDKVLDTIEKHLKIGVEEEGSTSQSETSVKAEKQESDEKKKKDLLSELGQSINYLVEG